jgi:hypothetical protein
MHSAAETPHSSLYTHNASRESSKSAARFSAISYRIPERMFFCKYYRLELPQNVVASGAGEAPIRTAPATPPEDNTDANPLIML